MRPGSFSEIAMYVFVRIIAMIAISAVSACAGMKLGSYIAHLSPAQSVEMP